MWYKVLVADTTDDLFGDSPYSSFLIFNNFESEEEALKLAKLMMYYEKAVAILPMGECNE